MRNANNQTAIIGKQTASKIYRQTLSVGMARYAIGKPFAALSLASLGEILSPNTPCLSADEQ